MSKKDLTSEQLEDCARLNSLFRRKKSALNLTQEKVASRLGITQPAVGHYLHGRNPLNLKAASAFAQILEVDLSEISPKLAQEAEMLGIRPVSYKTFVYGQQQPAESLVLRDSAVSRNSLPLVEWTLIDKYLRREIENERDVQHIEIQPPLPPNSRTCAVVFHGDSMWPDLKDGEYCVIDPERQPFHRCLAVVMLPSGNLALRRVDITPEGIFAVASNNSHPERIVRLDSRESIRAVVVLTWMKRI